MPTTRPAWSDDDIEAFRELARTFFEKECAPHEERWAEQQHVDREVWRKAGALGLLCPSVPEEYGGGGGTFAHEAVIAEEQIRAGAGGLGTAVHSTIVAHYVLNYGTEDQKRRWLPKLASGEFVGAIAMTEPGTGSDLQNVKTKAIKSAAGEGVAGGGSEYVLDGSKTFISNGLQANLILTVAKTDPENQAAGISLIGVETDTVENGGGFSRGRVLKKIGQHSQDTAELFFDGVHVPAANLLGEVEGQGFIQLMQQLQQERLVLAVAPDWTVTWRPFAPAVKPPVPGGAQVTSFGPLGRQSARAVPGSDTDAVTAMSDAQAAASTRLRPLAGTHRTMRQYLPTSTEGKPKSPRRRMAPAPNYSQR